MNLITLIKKSRVESEFIDNSFNSSYRLNLNPVIKYLLRFQINQIIAPVLI